MSNASHALTSTEFANMSNASHALTSTEFANMSIDNFHGSCLPQRWGERTVIRRAIPGTTGNCVYRYTMTLRGQGGGQGGSLVPPHTR